MSGLKLFIRWEPGIMIERHLITHDFLQSSHE